MEPIGVAVHGAGWVSGEHIKSLNKNPNSRVVAISSRRRESAESRAAEAGLTDVKIYTDYQALLRDPNGSTFRAGRRKLHAMSQIIMPVPNHRNYPSRASSFIRSEFDTSRSPHPCRLASTGGRAM